jgi:Ca2+-binding EF-hand superfamily protein
MLFALGFKEIQPQDIALSLEKIGISGSYEAGPVITLDEFIHFSRFFFKTRDREKELVQLFELFDEEGKGTISFRNLKKISKDVGLKLSDEILQEMISEADKDNDGFLSLSEFRSVMTRNSDYF